jgi:hypothetical protein
MRHILLKEYRTCAEVREKYPVTKSVSDRRCRMAKNTRGNTRGNLP